MSIISVSSVVRSVLLLTAVALMSSVSAQTPAQTNQTKRLTGALLDIKITRQMEHIENGLARGVITQQQADGAKAKLAAIKNQIDQRKAANGGCLKMNDIEELADRLTANKDFIASLLGAGKKVDDGPNVLGPNWVPGKDGAQNAQALRKEMKKEERRELRQENQAMQQVREQQQLQYEQEMMQKLGSQRAETMSAKKALEKLRQQQGN